VDSFKADKVTFIGEQDGPAERELKTRLIECLSVEIEVKKAYLVRVSYENNPNQKVAICIQGGGDRASRIVNCLGSVFSRQFSQKESLDVIFLTRDQLHDISAAAEPFFEVPSLEIS
jgi:hypothetical protein